MAVARGTDPFTSWAAAHGVTHVRAKQAAVLRVLADRGPLSLSQLVREYETASMWAELPFQSPSGVRTRAKELQDKALVVADGYRTNERGRTERLLHAQLPEHSGHLF